MAEVIGISRNLLYYEYKQEVKDLKTKKEIDKVLAKHKDYGHRRIAIDMKLNKKKILRVMKKYKIEPLKLKNKKPIKKDDLNKPHSGIENIIQNTCPIKPNVVWSSDFTYIKYKGSFLYLCTVIDTYTREIIGVQISSNHNANLVLDALIRAVFRRRGVPIYLHSDQGSEYISSKYINLIKANGIIFSNSNKSSPWENGHQESFFAHFKEEFGETERFKLKEELVEALYRQIYYYNNERIHTSLKTQPVSYFKKVTQTY